MTQSKDASGEAGGESGELLAIAHLAKPHGVRGEVSAIPLAPPVLEPGALIEGRRLFLKTPKGEVRPVTGLAVRAHQDRWLVLLEGVETREEADLLRGADLCLPRAELPPLPEGWHWEADLVGCRVIDAQLGELGILEELDTSYPQVQLVLRQPNGSKVLIPWRPPFIVEVDLHSARILVTLPSGFPGISDGD